MGTRIQRIVFDDLDNSTDTVATITFALEGVEYDIDLSEPHLGDLRTALAPYTTAGRRRPRTTTRQRRTGFNPTDVPAIRAWWQANAEQHGLPEFSSHGRVPAAVRTAYDTQR